MSAVSDRARSLARIAAVQGEMVKLAEWRIAAARRDRDTLAEDRARLTALVGGEEALGAALAKAALASARSLDVRAAQAEDEIARLGGELAGLRRKQGALGRLTGDAEVAARREDEAKALAQTMDAWLARAGNQKQD